MSQQIAQRSIQMKKSSQTTLKEEQISKKNDQQAFVNCKNYLYGNIGKVDHQKGDTDISIGVPINE